MNYYNTLVKGIKYKINAMDLLIANEVNTQLGETLVDVLDSDEEKKDKFEKICSLTWEVYSKIDGYQIQDIVSTIIDLLYDKVNTIDTITKNIVIDELK